MILSLVVMSFQEKPNTLLCRSWCSSKTAYCLPIFY